MGRVSNWGGCAIDPPPPLALPPGTAGEDELEVISGKVEFKLDGDATFSDQIILRSGNRTLSADGATYDADTGVFAVDGVVEFRDPETRVKGGFASFDTNKSEVRFEDAEFQLWSVPARGTADSVSIVESGQLRLRNVAYTSCPEGKDDWILSADKIKIDQETGVGTARNARLDFKGVPILFFPYISYPVTNQRKSGWLIPDLGSSERRGADLAFPYYWNIAPNYDATIIPRYMSKRGLQINSEFRYLRPSFNGVITGEYLNDDDVTDEDRSLVAWFHQSQLWRTLRGTIDFINVSDSAYFEDFSSSLASTSQIALERSGDLEIYNKYWTALLRVQDYEILDEGIVPEDRPYKRLPQLAIRGYQPSGLFGLRYTLDADVSNFDRNLGVTGIRAHMRPEIALPFRVKFIDFDPAVAVHTTHYNLNDTAPGEPDSPNVTVPIYSLDLSSVFERNYVTKQWLQTLEPRILYTYIPFEDQEDLPVFDTIEGDLNFVQLFRQNRYYGLDRIGDTNQLSLGLTTRMINAEDGDEFFYAEIGQTRYFSDRDVTLPDEAPKDNNSSDYITQLGMQFLDNWRTDLRYEWNSDASETIRAQAALRYHSGDSKRANIAYRFNRDDLEEIDASVGWPIGDRWNVVGRYYYSLEENEPLERFVGLEYETCCWGVRAVWRRHLTQRTGESDTSISVQLMLKGLSSSSSAAADLLDRGILDY